MTKKVYPELPDEEQFEPDYHNQPNGFHEAEDYTAEEYADPYNPSGFRDEEDEYTDPRVSQNQRYQDIQKAADLIWRILDTHSIGDTGVGKAFSDIRDRVKWSAETGQGLEDLV